MKRTPIARLPKRFSEEEAALMRREKREAAMEERERLARQRARERDRREARQLSSDTDREQQEERNVRRRLKAVKEKIAAEKKKLQSEAAHPFADSHKWTLATENADMSAYFNHLEDVTEKDFLRKINRDSQQHTRPRI